MLEVEGEHGQGDRHAEDGDRSPRREVRDELRQVAWPSRAELANYTAAVVTTLVLMISLIFVLNFGFGKAVLFLFQK